ncbi:MAG: hypothetical protein L3J34_04150 [Flavobacteriaceae bacterium]|nr:hypothetical protein [Flavobacteriaceae bacterium]
MKIKSIKTIIYGLTFISFINALLVKVLNIVLIPVSERLAEFLYDISIAIFTGGLVFIVSIVIPAFYLKKKRNEIVKNQFISMKNFIDRRIERFGLNNKDFNEERLFERINSLSYDTKIDDHIVYDSLHEIHKRVNEFYNEVSPLIIEMEDIELSDSLRSIKTNSFFKRNAKFLNYNLEDLKDTKLQIGKSYLDFIKKLKSFENRIK